MKKYFIALLIFITTFWRSFAFTSDDVVVIHAEDINTRTSFFVVPEGKDLLIHEIYVNDINEDIFIRNSNEVDDLIHFLGRDEFIDINVIVKDDLQLYMDPWTSVHAVIQAVLIDEGQDIKAIVDHEEYGINKPIFDEYTIQEIYLYEGILMLFIVIFTFFGRLLGYKRKKKNKYLN